MLKSIVIVAVSILVSAVLADDASGDWLDSGFVTDGDDFAYEPAIYWWRGGWGETFRTHDVVEFVAAKRLGRGPFVYENPVLTVVPIILRDDAGAWKGAYNFRAVACLLTQLAERSFDGRSLVSDKLEPRWWTYVFMAHNNTWKLRLSRGLRLAFTTRTDIPWLGFDENHRGVLFTPRLGLELVELSPGFQSNDPPLTNRLHVGVGRSYWLGFDGQRRDDGWTLVVGVAFLAAV